MKHTCDLNGFLLHPAANVRAGFKDPGESQEGGHGHLQTHRHNGQTVRRGPAAQLRGHDEDVQCQPGQVAPRAGE